MNRRKLLKAAAATAVVAPFAAPVIVGAQDKVLRITTWGGKWGEIMKGEVLPAFEKEHKCKLEVDSAFPYPPKLMASPKSKPIYDVLHSNTSDQVQLAELGLVEPKIDPKRVPNLADVYPYAISDKMIGVSIFTSAIGFGYRSDKLAAKPTSWKEIWDPKYAGERASYVIPINAIGSMFLMMAGKIYGKGYTDLDAAYKAMEALKPVKLYDFTGTMEKSLLSGEISIGVLHDSGILRYTGQNQPIAFAAPSEGVIALEQVLTITPGSQMKELANAYIDFMLRPDIQKRLAEGVWYSPSNRKVKLGPEYDAVLYNTEEKVKSLIQMDWKWYYARKDEIDARVNRIFKA